MKPPGKLTSTEISALVELLRHQNESDKSIAERLGMAPSNFAVVKKRLVEKGVLSEQIRINMHRVSDARVASLVWIEYNRPIRSLLKKEIDWVRSHMPVAYTYGSQDWSLNIDYFKSFEDAENMRLKLAEHMQQKLAPYVSNHMWKILPMAHLVTCTFKSRLAEYALTHKLAKPEHSTMASGGVCQRAETPENMPSLNLTEKKVLVAMRRFPTLKKSEVAKKVGIQQSSMSEVFRQLQRKGVINYTRTINPTRLPGRDIATFSWIELNRPMIGDETQNLINEIVETTPQLFKLHHTRTFIFINSFFYSLEKAESSHIRLLERFGNNIKSFNFKIIPCAHLTLDYAPYFLEHLFDVHFAQYGTPAEK